MSAIGYYSTNRQAEHVSFREALLRGQAPDRGLYMPERIPKLSPEELSGLKGLSYYETAFEILRRFLSSELPENTLYQLVKDAYTFPVPLEHVQEKTWVMRLDQGPTASFKDFAARMMARLMNYFLQQENRKLLVLTATSGDTGSAIASAFYGLDNIDVVILFPQGEVSNSQRKQMTTLGGNIQVIALDGKFDDCQALVKQAFSDPELESLGLTSANSINIGRLLPQSVYYFYAWAQLAESAGEPAVFSVPSGNFGNMMGSMIAWNMGLPVERVVVSTNENDEFPLFHLTGGYEKIVPSLNCISSAMNVGHPSNLARLVDLYGGRMDEGGMLYTLPDMDALRRDIYALSVDDKTTKAVMKRAWEKHGLLLEPHGAVGWEGLMRYSRDNPAGEGRIQVVLETAHPAKFPEYIREILAVEAEVPPSLQGLDALDENSVPMEADYRSFKTYLQNKSLGSGA